ncbi:MAG: hypothetical protein JETT_0304 [Candidatus Jettenia ecosi]|uniref:Uncharacterized protein n=1 Tax=Candidatus Jettenia ecosi TaxID=2494326 RepID=A0A533QFD9_9BACT|nr:MAG: hypothetical protein JETT_0304 [Candidatus Jettenia ecosi]
MKLNTPACVRAQRRDATSCVSTMVYQDGSIIVYDKDRKTNGCGKVNDE